MTPEQQVSLGHNIAIVLWLVGGVLTGFSYAMSEHRFRKHQIIGSRWDRGWQLGALLVVGGVVQWVPSTYLMY